jgi:hypothetical protein
MIGSPPRVSLVDVDRGQLIFRKMIVIVRRLLAVAVALSVGFAPSVLRVPAAVAGPWPALGDPTPVTPATAPAAVAPPAVMSEVTTPGATALDRVTISTDTTWGPQGSPYVITNGLTVAAPRALARELGDGRTGGYFGSAEDAVAAAGRGPVGATLQAGTGTGTHGRDLAAR